MDYFDLSTKVFVIKNMAVVIDENVSASLDEKLGANVWWKPDIDKKTLKSLCVKRSGPGAIVCKLVFHCSYCDGLPGFHHMGLLLEHFVLLACTEQYMRLAVPTITKQDTELLFKQRGLNDFFGYIFSFMTNFEPVRWRWTHTLTS